MLLLYDKDLVFDRFTGSRKEQELNKKKFINGLIAWIELLLPRIQKKEPIMISSLIASILLALVFALLLSFGFRRRGPGPYGGFVFLFIIIFMFTWAIGSLLAPLGPLYFGVSWLGYFLVAVMVMLLLGALIPRDRPGPRIISKSEVDERARQEKYPTATQISVGIFFWLMIFGLLVIVLSEYLR